ncbi:DEAD/DEAH box helicase [Loigolactobacillus rennini]|uniref:DEAD-box ATP-dependent RNA helicase CshB n=1 Tax=Loigolactobacillus rennini DSM 20253 TaxID=1423796 RepID=A0A0R2D5I9_9LACO|nr:DEAD/DEAH box helicase [Loigolactobacillus rennini]KRM95723.1 ATP-dependent RNA helicase [Loigolactobacillus rennini DSM 20253]
MTTFKAFKLKPYILQALDKQHFRQPTPIQQKLIPLVMAGKSVIGQSETGSGKTHAFLLPIFNRLDPKNEAVQVVITAPSRELATQLYQAAKQIADFSPDAIHVHCYVGGTDKQRQVDKLHHHQPQIVIGTPGRILDLINSQALKSFTATTFVVDEADMTMDMGFLNEVDKIAATFSEELQMLVFSATIPQKLEPFLRKYMKHPVVEKLKPASVISPTIKNWLISTRGRDKNHLIYRLAKSTNPYLELIFANTKQRVDEIADYLSTQGLKVAKISGELTPRERKRTMRQIKHLEFQYIVATDLAARGIDIQGISHVINTELPKDQEFFIHRVGRTGRNGLSGIAITIYEPGQEGAIADLEKLGITFQPKRLKGGQLVDGYDRNRRFKRQQTKKTLSPDMVGMVKKQKKQHKPGYKKRIHSAIKKDSQQKQRRQHRQSLQEQRRKNKR